MRALALHDEVTELDLLGTFLLDPSTTLRLLFGPTDALNGEALEEVVEKLVELALPPCAEAATEEQRIRPVHGFVSNDFLEERTRNLESIPHGIAGKSSHLATVEVDEDVCIT
jgi:hypothetical protein